MYIYSLQRVSNPLSIIITQNNVFPDREVFCLTLKPARVPTSHDWSSAGLLFVSMAKREGTLTCQGVVAQLFLQW